MEFQIGQRIGGRYEVHRILGGAGKSGMGVVYVCYDHRNGGAVALKTYQEGFFHDKILFDSFKRGALAWVRLDRHPYVVQAQGVFKLGDRLYLGLEYIAPDDEGRNNLSHHLRGRISVEHALRWAVQFCDAMEHARARGITPHRDIKPDNLLVSRGMDLKVGDFDLAGLGELTQAPSGTEKSSEGRAGLTFIQVGDGRFVAGTPPWMAPEQFEGASDARSDIYSFGVVLYQMAAEGRLPINARDGDWQNAHSKQVPPPVRSPLWPVIEQCLAKLPSARFGGASPQQSFTALREALAEVWKRHLPGTPLTMPPEGKAFEASDHNDKGVSLAALGLNKQALAEYKQAIALKPDYAPVYLNIGVSLAALKKMDSAAKAYLKALKLDPNIAEAHNNYGLFLKERGRLEEAERSFRRAIELLPEMSGAYENLGVLLSESGRLDEAVTLMQKAVGRDPTHPGHHYAMGVALEKAQRFDEALQSYAKAVELNPNRAIYVYGLGNAYRFLGDMNRAVQCWQKAAELDPKDAISRFNLGIAYERSGQLPAACHWYEAAIAADPSSPNAYYNYGLMLAQERLYGLGADAFENFVRHAGPELASHIPTAQGYIPKMRADEQQYLEMMKTDPAAVYNRALGLLNLGKLAEARPLFDLALQMRPDYSAALCGLGIWHERNGDFQSAAECYRKSIQVDPGFVVAWNNLGWASYNSGDLKGAERAYEKYLAAAPPDQANWIQGARQVLAEIRKQLASGG